MPSYRLSVAIRAVFDGRAKLVHPIPTVTDRGGKPFRRGGDDVIGGRAIGWIGSISRCPHASSKCGCGT
jgi:hypothetical protein